MCGLLIKTAALVGVAMAAGYLHSRAVPLMLRLPDQPAAKQGEPAKPAPEGAAGAGPVAGAPNTGAPAPAQPTGVQPTTTAATPVVEPPKATPPPAASDGWYIDLAEAKRIYDKQGAIFVDARTYDEFRKGHVPGALHMDKKYFDGAAGAMKAQHLKGQAVVIYCGGADCTDSDAVAKRLIALKFSIEPIKIMKDGLPGWQAAGYPVDVGEEQGFGG
ncbi:MAG: rhodanese-like domain-containing protein [Phycisphaerales bacterium]